MIYQLTITANPEKFDKIQQDWLCQLAGRSQMAPRIFFILPAWLCIINGMSKMTLPMCSNFSHLFLTVQVVWTNSNHPHIFRRVCSISQPCIGTHTQVCMHNFYMRGACVLISRRGQQLLATPCYISAQCQFLFIFSHHHICQFEVCYQTQSIKYIVLFF